MILTSNPKSTGGLLKVLTNTDFLIAARLSTSFSSCHTRAVNKGKTRNRCKTKVLELICPLILPCSAGYLVAGEL